MKHLHKYPQTGRNPDRRFRDGFSLF